jgi:hypothetical protein
MLADFLLNYCDSLSAPQSLSFPRRSCGYFAYQIVETAELPYMIASSGLSSR